MRPVASDLPDLESTSERTIHDLRGDGPLLTIGHYRYLEAQEPLPAQLHSRLLVLAFPVRGRFDFVIDGDIVAIEPGSVILIRPGRVYSTGIAAQTRGELLWLVADAAPRSTPGQGRRPETLTLRELASSEVTTARAPRIAVDLLTRALMSRGAEWPGTLAWRRTLCAAALMELARSIWQPERASTAVHPGVRRALDWANEHVTDPISVAELIRVSGMSSTHFHLRFVQTIGTSPKDYLMRTKIARAERLLADGDAPVTTIAHELGFSSSQHFGTAFKRYVGMSPTRFRSEATDRAPVAR